MESGYSNTAVSAKPISEAEGNSGACVWSLTLQAPSGNKGCQKKSLSFIATSGQPALQIRSDSRPHGILSVETSFCSLSCWTRLLSPICNLSPSFRTKEDNFSSANMPAFFLLPLLWQPVWLWDQIMNPRELECSPGSHSWFHVCSFLWRTGTPAAP